MVKRFLIIGLVIFFLTACAGFDGFDINGDGIPDGDSFPPESWAEFIDESKSKIVYVDESGTEKETPIALLR